MIAADHPCSLHPSVLDKFEIPYPVSAVELNLEAFL
jgi:phenylalanyl-tRNA synthetase beta chain